MEGSAEMLHDARRGGSGQGIIRASLHDDTDLERIQDWGMAKTDMHGQLIAEAAKAALLPLGCRRKGRSRVWYSDQHYWAIWVEFQPSGWSKGSYLNAGAMWLWRPKPSVAFSYRPVDFIPYESNKQFAPLVERMAARAAQEVQALRLKLPSFASVMNFIKNRATRDSWPTYDAAVACALAGEISAARQFFNWIQAWQTGGYEWQVEL